MFQHDSSAPSELGPTGNAGAAGRKWARACGARGYVPVPPGKIGPVGGNQISDQLLDRGHRQAAGLHRLIQTLSDSGNEPFELFATASYGQQLPTTDTVRLPQVEQGLASGLSHRHQTGEVLQSGNAVRIVVHECRGGRVRLVQHTVAEFTRHLFRPLLVPACRTPLDQTNRWLEAPYEQSFRSHCLSSVANKSSTRSSRRWLATVGGPAVSSRAARPARSCGRPNSANTAAAEESDKVTG